MPLWDSAQKELIVSRINLPLLRAGIANLYFPVVIFFIVIANEFINDLNIGFLGWIIVTLVVLFLTFNYLTTVSKIRFNLNTINIVTSISDKTISIKDIKRVKIKSYRTNSSIHLSFKLIDRKYPISGNFVVIRKTSFGNFKQTAHRLNEIFTGYNIPVIK